MTQAAIIGNNTGLTIPKQDLTPSLFDSFIKWIDRGEKTTRTYIVNLRQFVVWLRYSAITRPERQDIISYRQFLCNEHEAIQLDGLSWKYRTDKSGKPVKVSCKPNTIKQYLQSVCQFFKWTAAEGLYPNIAENIHAPKVKNDTHRKEALTAAEVQTIESSITRKAAADLTEAEQARKDTEGRAQRATEQGKRLYAMYLLTVTAGLRTIELSRANVKDLEEKGGCTYLYIWGKGHTEADTKKALAPEVAAAIKDYLKSRTDYPTGTSPLFVATGNRSRGKRLATTTISTMLKEAMKEAGFNSERLTAHSLRHTAGTNAMQLTGDLYTTQQYMRHSSPATTEIYLHIDTEQKEAEIAQRLYNHYHGIDNATDSREQLQAAMQKMSQQQLEQLATIAKTICK
ncbi:MAG: tyrosine-type recombinase/integrase [Clostridia bacterium]|nr:tyrosine-type recombinase/integrase [Clostridia bacterium]